MDDCRILAEELTAENVADRLRAAKMLAMLAEEAQAAIVPIVHGLDDSDDQVRDWLTEALENVGPPRLADAQTLANLAQTAAVEDIRYFALVLIGRLGERGSSVADELFALEEQSLSPTLLCQWLKTLARVCPKSLHAQLRELLARHQASPDPRVQATAERLSGSL